MDAQKPAGKMYKKYVKICGATPFPQELHGHLEISNVYCPGPLGKPFHNQQCDWRETKDGKKYI
jgi:hypothetical protein